MNEDENTSTDSPVPIRRVLVSLVLALLIGFPKAHTQTGNLPSTPGISRSSGPTTPSTKNSEVPLRQPPKRQMYSITNQSVRAFISSSIPKDLQSQAPEKILEATKLSIVDIDGLGVEMHPQTLFSGYEIKTEDGGDYVAVPVADRNYFIMVPLKGKELGANYEKAIPGKLTKAGSLHKKASVIQHLNLPGGLELQPSKIPGARPADPCLSKFPDQCTKGLNSLYEMKVVDSTFVDSPNEPIDKPYHELYYKVQSEVCTTGVPTQEPQGKSTVCRKPKTVEGWLPSTYLIPFQREDAHGDGSSETLTRNIEEHIKDLEKQNKRAKERCEQASPRTDASPPASGTTKTKSSDSPDVAASPRTLPAVDKDRLGACIDKPQGNKNAPAFKNKFLPLYGKYQTAKDAIHNEYSLKAQEITTLQKPLWAKENSRIKLTPTERAEADQLLKTKKELAAEKSKVLSATTKQFNQQFLEQVWQNQWPADHFNKMWKENPPKPSNKSAKQTGPSATTEQLQAIDSIARTLYGEMQGTVTQHSDFYYKAVARIMLNRVEKVRAEGGAFESFVPKNSLTHDSVKGTPDHQILKLVAESHEQFSTWNPWDPNVLGVLCPKKDSGAWAAAVEVAKRAVLDPESIKKETPDLKGVLFYTSNVHPNWSAKKKKITDISVLMPQGNGTMKPVTKIQPQTMILWAERPGQARSPFWRRLPEPLITLLARSPLPPPLRFLPPLPFEEPKHR